MTLSLRRHGRTVVAAVSVLAVYVLVLLVMPKDVFWSPDEGGKFLELHSLQWNGGLKYVLPYPGQRIDPAFHFYPHTSSPDGGTLPYPVAGPPGTLRFHWPIWFPLLSGYMLRAFGSIGLYAIPLLSGWLIALVSGRIAYMIHPRLAPLTIALVGLGTPVFFYSQCFWEHTLAALFGLLALAILLERHGTTIGTLLAMALPLVLASMLRIEMIGFAASALLAWMVRRRVLDDSAAKGAAARGPAPRWLPIVVLSAIAITLVIAVLLTVPTRQQLLFGRLPARFVAALQNSTHWPRRIGALFVNPRRSEGPIVNPTFVTVAFVAVALCFVAPLFGSLPMEAAVLIPALLIVLALSGWIALLSQTYRSLHAIFPVAPFLVIASFAAPEAWRRRDAKLLTLAIFALLYLIIGSTVICVASVDSDGGLEWGQRYIFGIYPVLTILSVAALDHFRESPRPLAVKRAVTAIVYAMMVVGIQLEIRGIEMLHSNRRAFALWDQALRAEPPIVTDLWWLPTTLAPLFLAQEMAYVQGPTELAQWASMAAAQGVSGFTFAGMVPVQIGQAVGGQFVARTSRTLSGLYVTRFDLVVPPH